MKYEYLYQTKENENRSGWITARDRVDAYAKLRKQGIRPYRLKGNDPIRWQPWAIFVVILLLISALAATVEMLHFAAPVNTARRQLEGDRAVISTGMANNWEGVFNTALDRHLAAYAQPGWIALPPEITEAERGTFAADLARPFEFNDKGRAEVKMLGAIVTGMRREMSEYLANGGTVAEYLDFLEERQEQERDFRNKALDAVERSPERLRERVTNNVNMRLREMGLPTLPANVSSRPSLPIE